ncbi:MAG: hypothetical protein CVU52_01365 [Deltaproteobacteria bacterium HGW-Deltaproteobacteria-10]|nr:MAG: hypothetical protein CVU52_01365 [Deltaproteobacteria bacterium HGW-Deltaproteobacteria-10]
MPTRQKPKVSSVRTIFMMSVLCVIALALGATQARAYCVYNDIELPFAVRGEFCAQCLYDPFLKPNDKKCCPGGEKGCRGETQIYISGIGSQFSAQWVACPTKVDAHGWIRFKRSGKDLTCYVYHEDGSLKGNDVIDIPGM